MRILLITIIGFILSSFSCQELYSQLYSDEIQVLPGLSGRIGVGVNSPQVKIDIGSSQSTGLQFRYDQSANYRIRLTPYWNSNADTRLDINVERSAGQGFTTVMSVGYNNNVGIGTTTPSHKLQVVGSIRATSFISNTQTYADFVFKDGYRLMPLEELERFITLNKHLPEIPPEDEALLNGINLSEMTVKLLQKVEELTLYIIEQNTNSIQQEERIKLLEREIINLKTKTR